MSDLEKLQKENAILRETLSNERDESMWRFWNDKARSIASDNMGLRSTIAAKDAEIAKLREALEKIAGQSGQFGFPWPETHVDYPSFALLTARAALKEASDA